MERIAVTVIGGYLGSGKTTLVNHILREAASRSDDPERIAVLVNDFGDINIDADLIESEDGDVLSLANGCICCSMVEGFANTLDTIVAMDPRPDRLVIEASGVSDPAQVAAYGHGPGLMMDAVIVLVDAETIRERVDDAYVGQTVTQQLASANVLILNKADLVSSDELERTSAWLAQRCPDAFVTTARNSQVSGQLLFGRTDSVDPRLGQHVHATADQFITWTIEREGPMSRAAIESIMEELPETVVRAKGYVWLEGSDDKPGVLQRVGRRWTLRAMGAWPDTPQTRIVVIGINDRR